MASLLEHIPRRKYGVTGKTVSFKSNANTRGEIEASVCAGLNRFEVECMGRGPQEIHADLIGDLLVVRLHGVLNLDDRQLISVVDAEQGCDRVKRVRTHLIEAARPVLEAMIERATGVQVIGLLHDLSTVTGKALFIFTLAAAPGAREAMKYGS